MPSGDHGTVFSDGLGEKQQEKAEGRTDRVLQKQPRLSSQGKGEVGTRGPGKSTQVVWSLLLRHQCWVLFSGQRRVGAFLWRPVELFLQCVLNT